MKKYSVTSRTDLKTILNEIKRLSTDCKIAIYFYPKNKEDCLTHYNSIKPAIIDIEKKIKEHINYIND